MSVELDEIVEETNYTQALKVALFHRRVTMVGYNPLSYKTRRGKTTNQARLPNIDTSQVCPCCGRFPREPMRVNFNISEIGFLGNGPALFFTYQKLCMVLLSLFLLLVTTNDSFYRLLRKNTSKDFWPDSFNETDLVCITVTLLLTIAIFVCAEYMVNLQIIVDETDTSPEDYSILVKNIPIVLPESSTQNPQTQLKNLFEKYFSTEIQVVDVSPCYNLVPLSMLKTSKKNLIEQYKIYTLERNKKKVVSEILFNSGQLPFEMHEYYGVLPTSEGKQKLKLKDIEDRYKDEIDTCRKKIDQGYSTNDLLFLGQAIVSFETQQMKQYILQNEEIEAYMYGHLLEFHRAQHPKGIFWYNLHLSLDDYKLRNIFSLIVCIAIVFMSLAIQFTLNYVKIVVAQEHKVWGQVLAYCSQLIVNIINLSIPMIMLKVLPNFEGHRSHSDGMLSFVKKSILLQLVNTLIVPVIVTNLITHDKSFTFIDKQSGILFRNAVFSLLGHAIPKKNIQKQLAIRAYQKGYSIKKFVKSLVTVKELCDMYEYPEFEIEYRSSQILKTALLTFVFGFQNYRVIAYSIIAMFCNYWIDKYNLSRCRTVSNSLNATLNIFMMRIVHLTVAMFLGSMICLHGLTSIKAILFVISLLMCLFPAIFTARMKTRRQKIEVGRHLKYTDCKKSIFETDYRRDNPALKGQEKTQFYAQQAAQGQPECKKNK